MADRRRLPIEITFDDGNDTDVDIALPALSERRLSATFFVCAGRIGTRGYLGDSAMAELLSAGMSIGSHGWAHVDWRRVDEAELDREIDGARQTIGDAIGRSVDQVAIPFGSYDRRVVGHLKRSRFRTVFTSDGGRCQKGDWLVTRETCTESWTADTLSVVAGQRPSTAESIRRSVARRLKQWR